MVRQISSTILGKAVKKVASLRGGGSALPGLVIEKIDSGFLARTLKQIPHGVVIISGTNGKTTTTKIVVELLESAGMKVFTNKTGSNFSRGVVAALLGEIDMRGKISADIAVLELDEAWAAKFVEQVKPKYSLLLNVLRDQLDRFGEIDTTAKLLEKIAKATFGTVVLNKDDPRICAIASSVSADAKFFGTTDELLKLMPADDDLKSGKTGRNAELDVLLENISDDNSIFLIDGKKYDAKLALTGIYNTLNAAAALALARQILNDSKHNIDTAKLIKSLEKVQPAFGRGETIIQNGRPIELILVKNPSGFRLALMSFATKNTPIMIAINDNYADGRDMSWLWDVDFSKLEKVAIVTGVRAYDMALRLKYDDISPEEIDPNLDTALGKLIDKNPNQPLRIFATYTAMIRLRKKLANLTDVEEIK